MINLNEATVMGFVLLTLILIAIKADPHIALKTIKRNILLDRTFFNRNFIFYFSE